MGSGAGNDPQQRQRINQTRWDAIAEILPVSLSVENDRGQARTTRKCQRSDADGQGPATTLAGAVERIEGTGHQSKADRK